MDVEDEPERQGERVYFFLGSTPCFDVSGGGGGGGFGAGDVSGICIQEN